MKHICKESALNYLLVVSPESHMRGLQGDFAVFSTFPQVKNDKKTWNRELELHPPRDQGPLALM